MIPKIEKLPGLFLCVCLFALAGCGLFGLPMAAQQGGGLTAPTVQSQAGNKNIVPSATRSYRGNHQLLQRTGADQLRLAGAVL